MTKYLISFPSRAMIVAADELPAVSEDAHAVIAEAKAAGVYMFGGGINESVDPVLVAADGSVSSQIYLGSELDGGFAVLEYRLAQTPSSGRARSLLHADVRRNCASSCTIPRAKLALYLL